MNELLLLITLLPLETDGVFDWVTDKNADAMGAARALAVTVAIIFVLVIAVKSQMAAARVIVAGLVAAILVAIVWNVTKLGDRVENEFDTTGVISSTVQPDAARTDKLPTL